MAPSKAPVTLVDFVEAANLNQVRWNQGFLEEVRSEYALKHGQAVVYCNAAQDRFRLVACFYGLAVLILPPVNPEEKHSLYLKVSEFLKQFTSQVKMTKRLDEEAELAKSRIARRKAQASKVKKRRK